MPAWAPSDGRGGGGRLKRPPTVSAGLGPPHPLDEARSVTRGMRWRGWWTVAGHVRVINVRLDCTPVLWVSWDLPRKHVRLLEGNHVISYWELILQFLVFADLPLAPDLSRRLLCSATSRFFRGGSPLEQTEEGRRSKERSWWTVSWCGWTGP